MADGRRTVNPIHKKLSGFESHPSHTGNELGDLIVCSSSC